MQSQLFNDPTPAQRGDLIFFLELDCDRTPPPPKRKPKIPKLPKPKGPNPVVPSWNDILGMEQFERYRFKERLASIFLSALRASADASLMKTTCAKNTSLIFADTLALYLETSRAARKLKLRNKRLKLVSGSSSESKSTLFEKPPF